MRTKSAKQKYNFLFTRKPFARANRAGAERIVKMCRAFGRRNAKNGHKNTLCVQKPPNLCPLPDKKIVFL